MTHKKTDKVSAVFKRFIIECFKKHAAILNVGHYEMDIYYMREASQVDAAMSINIRRRYLDFVLRIYPAVQEMWRKGERDEIDAMVAHETAHLVTQHMMDIAVATYKDEGETTDAWEALTETIGRLSVKIASLKNK